MGTQESKCLPTLQCGREHQVREVVLLNDRKLSPTKFKYIPNATLAASPQRISESPLHLDGNGSTSGGMATVPNRPKQTTKKRGRPAIQLSKVATQRTAARPDPVTSPSADEPHPGRKSGRLREKGPTTYTSKGEIIRGGKRINEEIHDQGMTKRARYATPI